MSHQETGTSAGNVLRRRWWAVLVGILLGVVGAAALTAAQPVRYESTTSVLVLATQADPSLTTGRPEVSMDTEAELVRSAQVAQIAKAALKSSLSTGELLAGLEVTVPRNSQVLSIAYTDGTAVGARSGAEAFAAAYLTFRGDEAKAGVAARNTALRNELSDAEEQLRLATDKAAALPPNAPERVYAEAQRTILGNRISTLAARLSTLSAASPSPGQVITAAALPDAQSSPTTLVNYVAGLIVGLLLGTALAALADRMDHRLRHRRDVARLVGEPCLLEGPRIVARTLADGGSPADYDRLRNSLGLPGGPPGVLQVVDVTGNGASAPVAVGTAQALVRATGAALLVIARPDSPLTKWLALDGHDGLSELLTGERDLNQVLVSSAHLPGLAVVPAGRAPEKLETLLQSTATAKFLKLVRAMGGPVVIDTLGTQSSAAAQGVAAGSDQVVLVAQLRQTDGRHVRAAAEAVRAMGTSVAGVVLTPELKPTAYDPVPVHAVVWSPPRVQARGRRTAGGASPASGPSSQHGLVQHEEAQPSTIEADRLPAAPGG